MLKVPNVLISLVISCYFPGPNLFVLLSEEAVVYRVLLSAKPEAEVPLNFKALISITSIEYNIKTEIIYWLDSKTSQIKYLTPSRKIEILDLKTRRAEPISFAIDFFSNTLFWVNKQNYAIMFINLDNPHKNGVVFQNEKFHPRKLAVLPEKG